MFLQCSVCRGTKEVSCSKCGGEGWVFGVTSKKCSECTGTGKKSCFSCKGTGQIKT